MKKLLSSLILLAALSAAAQPVPVGPRYIGVPSIAPVALSSNDVYLIAVAAAQSVGGATNGIEKFAGSGTNTTIYTNFTVVGDASVSGDITGNNINAGGTFNGDGDINTSLNISAGGTISATLGLLTDSITNLAGNVFALFASGGGFYFYDPNAGNLFLAGDDTTVSLYANAIEVFAGKEDYTEVLAQNTTNKLHISENGNIFTGPISSSGMTNSGTTDALIYADANGRHREVTIGANLTFSAGTLSATGGGGGSDTNGISYANVAWPAFGTTGNEEAWLKYTNGVKAITAINDAGSSRLVFTNYDGTYIANFDNTGFIALNITETDGTPVLSQANNVRTLSDGSGTVAIDFASATGVQINGIILNTPSWDEGELLGIVSGQVSGVSSVNDFTTDTLNVSTVAWRTNQGLDYAVDLSKQYSALSTNNNISLTGLLNINTGASDTNVQWAVQVFTNTSGSSKTITIPASWIGNQGTTLYNTNQGILSVLRYPGFGTNYVWRPLN